MTDREIWGWRDKRTGQPVSVSTCFTREYAERELEYWWARDRRGGRPDLHDLMPYIEVFRMHPPEEANMSEQTYDVGYSKQKQYGHNNARLHIVQKTEGADPAGYRLLCTKTPGTREYAGFLRAVACPKCKEIVHASTV